MKKKKLLAVLLASAMVMGMAACGNDDAPADNSTSVSPSSDDSGNSAESSDTPPETPEAPVVDTYTFHDYMPSMPKNWNDHAWQDSGEDILRGYLSSPFCTMSILDSEEGVYQWVYYMATSIEDVTAAHQDDLTKYAVNLPEGAAPETITDGYVFEIKLNPDAKWEDGTVINADSYIYSMKQLLNPEMKNYRANLTYAGESAVAGGNAYYNAGSEVWQEAAPVAGTMEGLTVAEDGTYTLADGSPVYVSLTDTLSWLSGNTLTDYVDAYGEAYFGVEDFTVLQEMADENGHVLLTKNLSVILQA